MNNSPAAVETVVQSGTTAARRRKGVRLAIAVLCAAAVAQLTFRIDRTPLAVDEAESAINAFSILEDGLPGGMHLGIPVYENMLIRPWPSHPEYEFRDVSYSDRGYAIYHGWLPLYLIAGSFRLAGITPPVLQPGWAIDVDRATVDRRTIAARAPAFLTALVLIPVLFSAAVHLAGMEAGLAILVLCGQSSSVLAGLIFARYYALMMLLSAIAWLTMRKVVIRGTPRDFAIHGFTLVALFYTQPLAFLTLMLLTVIGLQLRNRDPRVATRYFIMSVVVLAVTLPWLWQTGFFDMLNRVPSGLTLLRFPGDVTTYIVDRLPYFVLFAGGAAWFVWPILVNGREGRVVVYDRWRHAGWQFTLLAIWMVLAVCLWFVGTPAASLFPQRLSLSLFVPGLMLMAAVVGTVARLMPFSTIASIAGAWLVLAAAGVLHLPPGGDQPFEKLHSTFDALNALHLRPDAKVYASPGRQLVLSFYSDKPIQSLAPVRKRFLDSYPGEIVYLEGQFDWEFAAPDHRDLQRQAARLGQELTSDEARNWERRLRTRFACERAAIRAAEVRPPLEPLPAFAEAAMKEVRVRAGQLASQEQHRWDRIPFSRGYAVRSGADLWEVFFYRLVDSNARRGGNLNAAARLRNSIAECLPVTHEVLFYSPHP